MKYKLYIDLDGVIVDFDRGCFDLFNKFPSEVPDRVMWPIMAKTKDYFYNLHFMPDGKELWNYAKQYNPSILTGIPRGVWASEQKIRWVADKLGKDVPVFTTLSRLKFQWSGENCILVDDRESAKEPWEAAGGIFILHIDAENSISQLKEYLK